MPRPLLLLLAGGWAALLAEAAPPPSSTLAPILRDSYICLQASLYQNMCVGFSPGNATNITNPSGNQLFGQQLQIKRRDKNQDRGTTYKTSWDVDRKNGSIRAANYLNLCIDRSSVQGSTDQVVLRSCYAAFSSPPWNLTSFLSNINQGGVISTRVTPGNPQPQCVTAMRCQVVQGAGYCAHTSSTSQPMSNSEVTQSPTNVYGSYLALTPCVSGMMSQYFVQALNCAPGCAPSMLVGKVCYPECKNQACNWGNGACATPKPTPPTRMPSTSPTWSPSMRPSQSPSSSPSSMTPSVAPSRKPSQSPSRQPSRSPNSSAPSRRPTFSPSRSSPSHAPSHSPHSSGPSRSPSHPPSVSPSREPTASPSEAPSAAPTSGVPTQSPSEAPSSSPTSSPSGVPSMSPIRSPSDSPTRSPSLSPGSSVPSFAPTRSPTAAPTFSAPSFAPTRSPTHPLEDLAHSLLGLWIFLGLFLSFCCFCFCVPVLRPRVGRDGEPDVKAISSHPEVIKPRPKAAKRPYEDEPYFGQEPASMRRDVPNSNPFEDDVFALPSEPSFTADHSYMQEESESEEFAPPTRTPPPPPEPLVSSFSSNPEKPRTGEAGMFWSGGRADPDAEQPRDKRAIERQNTGRVLEGAILPELQRRIDDGSFRQSKRTRPPPPPPRPPPKPKPEGWEEDQDHDGFDHDV